MFQLHCLNLNKDKTIVAYTCTGMYIYLHTCKSSNTYKDCFWNNHNQAGHMPDVSPLAAERGLVRWVHHLPHSLSLPTKSRNYEHKSYHDVYQMIISTFQLQQMNSYQSLKKYQTKIFFLKIRKMSPLKIKPSNTKTLIQSSW